MASYTLSGKADEDVENIARATLQSWGMAQAETYILALNAAFERLVVFPELGRDASSIRVGYRRLETGSHFVFYRITESGILIVRVLHQRMDFKRHL